MDTDYEELESKQSFPTF